LIRDYPTHNAGPQPDFYARPGGQDKSRKTTPEKVDTPTPRITAEIGNANTHPIEKECSNDEIDEAYERGANRDNQ